MALALKGARRVRPISMSCEIVPPAGNPPCLLDVILIWKRN